MQIKVFKTLLFFAVYFSALLFFAKNINAASCPIPNQDPCWIEKSLMPISRWGHAGTTDVNGNIYIIGGYNGNGTRFYSNLDVFILQNNTWVNKSNAPIEIVYPGFAYSKLTNKFYLAGGVMTGNIVTNNVYEYSPNNDTWTLKNSLPLKLNQLKLIGSPNGKIYAVGGGDENGICNGTIIEYDVLNDAWSTKSNMPTPRCDPAVTVNDQGIIYTIGGNMDFRFNRVQNNIVEAYDPTTNTWTTKQPMNEIRYGISGSAITTNTGKIIVAGGAAGNLPNGQLTSVEEYDPATNIWTYKTPMPFARDLMQLVYSENKIYAIGGRTMDAPETVTGSVLEGLLPEPPVTNINLNVPLVKQTNPNWASKEYDLAKNWNPTDSRIYSWGCALTSAVMVFNYHGLKKLSNSTQLNPGTLNDWLKKQKDGYVGNGNINWIALSRLSKEIAKTNKIQSFDALEFTKQISTDKNKVIQDLQNNIPDILGVPGHFIVAKGTSNSIIAINDPGFNRNSLSEYNNTFSSINKFTPSNTDLSYIMVTTNPNTSVELLDSSGNPVGDSFIEEPITSLSDPNQNNGALRIIYLPKPNENNYSVVVTSGGNYEIKIYLYDKDGDVFTKTEKGNLPPEQNKTIPLYFNPQNELYPRRVTYLSTALDIERYYVQKRIIGRNLKRDLEESLARAYLQKLLNNDEKQLRFLAEFEEILNENRPTNIKEDAYNTLIYDVNYLSSHLNY